MQWTAQLQIIKSIVVILTSSKRESGWPMHFLLVSDDRTNAKFQPWKRSCYATFETCFAIWHKWCVIKHTDISSVITLLWVTPTLTVFDLHRCKNARFKQECNCMVSCIICSVLRLGKRYLHTKLFYVEASVPKIGLCNCPFITTVNSCVCLFKILQVESIKSYTISEL